MGKIFQAADVQFDDFIPLKTCQFTKKKTKKQTDVLGSFDDDIPMNQ